jgi:endonuclease/exonuclease/phosphatase family metal-dependent hydrolase
MPAFDKPAFTYNYSTSSQIQALQDYVATEPGRAIPPRDPTTYRVASWNVANLGLQDRRDKDYRLLAEMVSWFDLVALQEVNDNLEGLNRLHTLLPGYRVLFSDKAGNDERMAFIFDSARVGLLDKVGEIAVPPRWKYVIRVPGSTQKFRGFDRNPYLAGFRLGGLDTVLVNVHLYYGKNTAHHKNRRFMEALATARWADLRRQSANAFSKNIMVMGDFNLEKVGWDDPMWVVLGKKGLLLVPHSTYVGGSNILDDRPYDQLAFFPGPIEDRIQASGVFDFDNALFKHLWDTRPEADFMAYMRYYISDHRILWVALDTN